MSPSHTLVVYFGHGSKVYVGVDPTSKVRVEYTSQSLRRMLFDGYVRGDTARLPTRDRGAVLSAVGWHKSAMVDGRALFDAADPTVGLGEWLRELHQIAGTRHGVPLTNILASDADLGPLVVEIRGLT